MEMLSRTVISVFFQVESRDTLNSIALKFDTTPNKLVQLNKLFSRAVVPGQVWAPVHAVTHHHVQITTSTDTKNTSIFFKLNQKKHFGLVGFQKKLLVTKHEATVQLEKLQTY